MASTEKNDAVIGEPGRELVLASDPGLAMLAERLVAAARTQGVQLTSA
jgi:hypothetical protein